jgi:hypothetical protein
MTAAVESATRDASRDGSTLGLNGAPTCALCGKPLRSRHRLYCSPAHRQRAFRLRHAAPLAVDDGRLRSELRRRGRLVAHTVYECSVCGDRFVGQRRCPQDNVFCRALGLGGYCTDCEQPILLADLLELEVLP